MDLLIRKKLREQFTNSDAHGPYLLSFLDGNNLELNRIEILREGPDFFAHLELTPALRLMFGLRGDELLLLVLHHSRQEQWFLSTIRTQLKEQDRLSKSAVLIFSPDERITDLCRAAFSDNQAGYKTAHVALTFKEIRVAQDRDQQNSSLYAAFKKQAFTIDHFDTRGPVPDDLFGRNALIAQIESDIRVASEGVAILGIRRVGKTSVLKRVLTQLQDDPDDWWLVGYYDAQADTVEANLQTVTSRLQASLRQAALQRASPVPSVPKNLSAQEQLRAVIEHLITQGSFKIALAIDEIEWLVPSSNTDKLRANEALVLFGLLRSLKQQYGNRLALVLCGINETFCEMPQINGYPNPNLDWYRTHYVNLLSQEDATEMLSTLGHRMGIDFSSNFLDEVWSFFGGHAYLARQFCSETSKKLTQRPIVLTKNHFDATYADFMVRASIVFQDILKHLALFYPNEYNLLRKIAIGEQTLKQPGVITRHLEAYGLVSEQAGQLTIPLIALTEFASKHSAEDVQRERFKLIAPLGGGATSTVWRAWDNDSKSDCALKIFQGGVPEKLVHDELSALRDIGSKYVPKPIGIVRFENQVALAMEFVGGSSLESILKEGTKLLGNDLLSLSYHLFESLASIHPEVDRIQLLIERGEMSPLGAVEFFDLRQRGHLHRDLKPANIVVLSRDSWEIRLIDLGLTTSADRAGLSRVGTPDYSPPDLGVSRWDASFDLYALGRILSRCVFGRLLSSEEDLINACAELSSAYRDAVRAFFTKALAPSSANRYPSVKSMKAAWDNAVLAFI
ncbi:protein kinase domain-containing protein [Stigmatella erecta]|uniref:Serine/threonine protein kinase n=1 Tax=Stigmatella erecta TaxID=83460 RepID=A0A1I0A284_9BACT|nr:ATP-binding protein [Stigmatella erecta]SES88247.1 Serine/threonine protein kinase [Stigmatella erecta]